MPSRNQPCPCGSGIKYKRCCLGARFAAGGERRWRARLATQPNDPAQAGLALLEFHPGDVAEPLPDTVELQAVKWSITNDEAVLVVLEHDDSWECLGQALPDGWAFAWPDREQSGAIDLGGWRERPGEIEAARLIVRTDASSCSAPTRACCEGSRRT